MPPPLAVARLKAIQAWDRLQLRALAVRHPGLALAGGASSNFAVARYALAPGARLRIDAGAVTDRIPGALSISLGPGALVEIGAGTWLRTAVGPLFLVAFEGARLQIGPECLVNGCHLSAKRELAIGRRVSIGVGTRVFDADQHDLDDEHPELCEPVSIGDCAWIASDVTVLRGARIGPHSVVGARSLVSGEIPPHSLAYGSPARVRGPVGDRFRTR